MIKWGKVATIVVVAIVSGLLLGTIAVTAIATQLFDFKILTVQSDSMRPLFERGDVIVVRPRSVGELSRGDVIAFRSQPGSPLIAHRVVSVTRFDLRLTDSATGETGTGAQFKFQTKGDSNSAPDTTVVDGEQVAGEVWFTVPNIGFGFGGVSLQNLMFAMAGLVGLSWLSWELYKRLGRPEEEQPQLES